ncbi:MAG TPA: alpha/beta fold hydrolase [Pyrinomonadaceae bacterium]|nr:alpha/beta fold hydrolase [Pyrinomonadaceae bacterium]
MIRAHRFAGFVFLVLFATFQAASTSHSAAEKPTIELTPCKPERITGDAKCGTLEVFENRATQKGRKIKINVLVLPATGPQREPDALFYFAGGPGSAATEDARGIAQNLANIRQRRDLVFVDQRGTGQSNPLNCELFNSADPQSYFGFFLPLDDVRKCRAQLEPKADLTLYTTNIAMDDLDDIRAALGYEQINLYGGSYGTRAALVYLRRHPKHVRSVILHGVAPTNQFMPRNFAQDTERALQGVLSECEADEACRKAFPQVKADAQRVLEQLLQSPAEAEVQLPRSKDKVTLKLNRNLAAEAVRYMMYSPNGASRVPLFLHLAAEGDYAPLARAALMFRQNLVATGSNGMYLSVTCAEDLPFVKAEEAKKIGANTFLGSYRYDQQSAACELWPRAMIDKKYAEPVRSDKPVLVMTGEWDPVTPPSQGDAVAKTLPNSVHIVVNDGAHGLGGLQGIDCLDRLMTQFVERGSVKDLDTSCTKNIKRNGFVLKL